MSIAITEVDQCFATPDRTAHRTELSVDALTVVVIHASARECCKEQYQIRFDGLALDSSGWDPANFDIRFHNMG
jgi:hypothetical protein